MRYSLYAERIIFQEFITVVLIPTRLTFPLPHQVTLSDWASASLAILEILRELLVADIHDELIAVAEILPPLRHTTVESCPHVGEVDIKLRLAILQFFFQDGNLVDTVIIIFRVNIHLVMFIIGDGRNKNWVFH